MKSSIFKTIQKIAGIAKVRKKQLWCPSVVTCKFGSKNKRTKKERKKKKPWDIKTNKYM